MKDNNMVRGGQLLAKSFKEKGIDHVFTLAGGFCNPALEGFMNHQIPVINCPHEQIAGHLADGHTRLSRKPSVCLVGPEGFANAIPAMMEAWGERSPVIFVTGSSTLKKQGAGGFKEIDDVSIARPLTKYSASITDGNRIPEFVDRAWRIATSGYPGPVHLSMPVDIMFSSFDESFSDMERPFTRKEPKTYKAWPEPSALNEIIGIIKSSKKPIIIGGHGIWWSKNEDLLKQVGDEIEIPIFNVPYHQKLLNENCKAFLGLADVHQYHPSKFAFNESDCIIMVGGRLDNQMNFGNPPLFPASSRLICVNGSHEEIEFNRAADHLLLSDPGAFFEGLLESYNRDKFSLEKDWLAKNIEERKKWVSLSLNNLVETTNSPAWSGGKIHPLELSLSVQKCMTDQDILVFDGGNTHFWSEIAVNIMASNGLALSQIMHPGSYSMRALECHLRFRQSGSIKKRRLY